MRSLLQGGSEADLRFQFEVIKQLSDSVRQSVEATRDVARNVADMQKTQVTVSERLAKLESNRVNEQVAKMEERLDGACARVDKLEQDKDRRDGAGSFLGGVFKFGPAIFSLLTVLYLFGRSIGIVPSPPTTVTKVETPVVIERRAETIGGKP